MAERESGSADERYIEQLRGVLREILAIGGPSAPHWQLAWDLRIARARRLLAEQPGRALRDANLNQGIPYAAEGLTWEQFWDRVRQIEFNPSPGEMRAALRRYEDRECPKCHKQLADDEIIGSCMDRNDGIHRRVERMSALPGSHEE